MKFLIVKTSSLGDVIQTFPVVEYLKKRYPDASIDWVVENEYVHLIGAHPDIRRAIPFHSRTWRKTFFPFKQMIDFASELRQEKYDVLFDLQGNTKSSLITTLAKAEKKVGFGWKSVAEFPNFFATRLHIETRATQIQERYLELVRKFFGDENDFLPQGVSLKLQPEEEAQLAALIGSERPRVMVACGSRWINKQLAETTLQEIVQKIGHDPFFYFVWGSPKEKLTADKLHAQFPKSMSIGKLSFPLWQAVMREMDLVVTVDSAPLALCGTTKTPSLSFFGPSLASVYKPLGDHHTAWQGSCPYEEKFLSRCPYLRTCKTGACLKSEDNKCRMVAFVSAKISSSPVSSSTSAKENHLT